MFCPSNETLLSLTEKTKLLAQKCTQQIRAQSGLSPMKREPPPAAASVITSPCGGDTSPNITMLREGSHGTTGVPDGDGRPDSVSPTTVGGSLNCFNARNSSFKLLQLNRKQSSGCCALSASLSTAAGLNNGVGPKERTTKWYVKVIQMAR